MEVEFKDVQLVVATAITKPPLGKTSMIRANSSSTRRAGESFSGTAQKNSLTMSGGGRAG